jgi:transcription initiation factor TFIID subunit 8
MASDDRYAMGISRIIAGQLASEQGFEEVQQSALDILADLLNRYILEAGNRTHLLTELSHRTESTAIDVVSPDYP